MSKLLTFVSKPVNAFVLSAIPMVSGLVTRRCVAASDGILMPLCNGETMFVQTGQSAMIHCSGCYVALLGFLGMIAAASWSVVKPRLN